LGDVTNKAKLNEIKSFSHFFLPRIISFATNTYSLG